RASGRAPAAAASPSGPGRRRGGARSRGGSPAASGRVAGEGSKALLRDERGLVAREDDPRRDQDPAGDLQRRDRLGQDQEREDRAEEGLEVRVEGGPRRADAVDGVEPEQVRQEERAEHRERVSEPDERG